MLQSLGAFQNVGKAHKTLERLSLLASNCKCSCTVAAGSYRVMGDILGTEVAELGSASVRRVLSDGCGLASGELLDSIGAALQEKESHIPGSIQVSAQAPRAPTSVALRWALMMRACGCVVAGDTDPGLHRAWGV